MTFAPRDNTMTQASYVKLIKTAITKRAVIDDKSKGSIYYRSSRFALSRIFLKCYARMNTSQFDIGIIGLLTARAGGVMTAKRLAAAGLIDASWRDRCTCGMDAPETFAHLLCDCPTWNADRDASKLGSLIAVLRLFFPPLNASSESLATVLLGGYAPGSNINLGQAFLHSFHCHHDGIDYSPGYLIVANFLTRVYKRRLVILNAGGRSPSPSGYGGPGGEP
jgi:hypothetical protein